MPYKSGKLKGELTAPELRRLIKEHNKLMSIKIPPKTDRDGLIKLIKDNGYKINHEDQMLIPVVQMKRKQKVKLPPKPSKEFSTELLQKKEQAKIDKDKKKKQERKVLIEKGKEIQKKIDENKNKKKKEFKDKLKSNINNKMEEKNNKPKPPPIKKATPPPIKKATPPPLKSDDKEPDFLNLTYDLLSSLKPEDKPTQKDSGTQFFNDMRIYYEEYLKNLEGYGDKVKKYFMKDKGDEGRKMKGEKTLFKAWSDKHDDVFSKWKNEVQNAKNNIKKYENEERKRMKGSKTILDKQKIQKEKTKKEKTILSYSKFKIADIDRLFKELNIKDSSLPNANYWGDQYYWKPDYLKDAKKFIEYIMKLPDDYKFPDKLSEDEYDKNQGTLSIFYTTFNDKDKMIEPTIIPPNKKLSVKTMKTIINQYFSQLKSKKS
jgi:hypothetical protein